MCTLLIPNSNPLEKEMAFHSSILAWEIPWTEVPGRLQSIASKESDMTQQLNHHNCHLQNYFLNDWFRTSLEDEWLRFYVSNAKGMGAIPGQGITWCGKTKQKKKEEEELHFLNNSFK